MSTTEQQLKKHRRVPDRKNAAQTSLHISTVLILAYIWWLFATPYNSKYFSWLTGIYFERLLVFFCALIALFGNKKWRSTPLHLPLFLFFGLMMASHLISPYQYYSMAQKWFADYWKLFVFYILIIFSLRNIRQFSYFFSGTLAISIIYQLISWRGFLGGGSYVWQQGVKRMVGAWSGEGLGAPNAYGFLAVFTVPFVLAKFRSAKTLPGKSFFIGCLFICALSAVFSGTRAVFVTLFFLLMIDSGKKIFRIKHMVIFFLTVGFIFIVVPQNLTTRLIDKIIPSAELTENNLSSGSSADVSAISRLDGLVDGVKLFVKRPLLGYGPGTSPIARLEVTSVDYKRKLYKNLQMHNLYGQLLSEGGVLCAGTFFMFILAFVKLSRRLAEESLDVIEIGNEIRQWNRCLIQCLGVMLFYGLFTHNLYRYHWFLLGAMLAVLWGSVSDALKESE